LLTKVLWRKCRKSGTSFSTFSSKKPPMTCSYHSAGSWSSCPAIWIAGTMVLTVISFVCALVILSPNCGAFGSSTSRRQPTLLVRRKHLNPHMLLMSRLPRRNSNSCLQQVGQPGHCRCICSRWRVFTTTFSGRQVYVRLSLRDPRRSHIRIQPSHTPWSVTNLRSTMEQIFSLAFIWQKRLRQLSKALAAQANLL
jgi:hypothetical protein